MQPVVHEVEVIIAASLVSVALMVVLGAVTLVAAVLITGDILVSAAATIIVCLVVLGGTYRDIMKRYYDRKERGLA